MRNKLTVSLLSLALIMCAAVFARAQKPQDPNEEDVRGAFLSTRVTGSAAVGSTGSSASASRTRRRTKAAAARRKTTTARTGTGKVGVGTKSTTVKTNNGTSATTTTGIGSGPVKAYASAPIGLGYSLYMRDPNGDPMRVDPSRVFRSGDGIRISLETNTDGFLYVFHTENNGEPQMIYPNAQLDEGENFVEAHVPYEIPWSGEGREEHRWFFFDQNPANERLYIVLAREPLPGVPTNEELVNYCRPNPEKCTWRPTTGFWSQFRLNAEGKVVVDKKDATYGQKQTAGERDATTRGLSLGTSAPEPSIVRMNVSSDAGVLVTALDLIHQ